MLARWFTGASAVFQSCYRGVPVVLAREFTTVIDAILCPANGVVYLCFAPSFGSLTPPYSEYVVRILHSQPKSDNADTAVRRASADLQFATNKLFHLMKRFLVCRGRATRHRRFRLRLYEWKTGTSILEPRETDDGPI